MPISPHLRRGLIAFVLLCAAVGSTALTLGRSRGAALIGRPLDVAIALTLDSSGQANELCPEADVFQGDSRVDASRVSVVIESPRGQETVIRVRSSQAVDEPVVTIYLRLGCNLKTTRRYVLLSEEPAELSAQAAIPLVAATVAPVPLPGTVPRVTAAEPTQAQPAVVGAQSQGRSSRNAAARGRRDAHTSARLAEPVAPRVPASKAEGGLSPPASKRGARVASSRPRLQLDIVELGPERAPGLRASAGLAAEPSTSEQVRAKAAALWRSINAQPEDVLRDLQRVQALEDDVRGLRTLVAGNDHTLGELREQLNEARQERSLTLAATALLTLLLAAMIVTWWLRRSERTGAGEWWRRGEPVATAGTAAPGLAAKTAPSAGGRVEDADLQVDESMFDSLRTVPKGPQVIVTGAPPGRSAPARSVPAGEHGVRESVFGFQSSQSASMRMVKAEELVDIQQQADFFVSIGQTEQAIDLLGTHIRDHSETSALVWLDLLAIYRAIKRRDAYELLRGDFQRVFNAEVPAYDSTPTVSGGLEDYPRALSRIAALWPSPKVMDLIEESIFRRPGSADGEPFDLEAYRELVMLYNLGREVVEAPAAAQDWTESGDPVSNFFETAMQPLSVGRRGLPTHPGAGAGAGYGQREALDTPFDVDSMMGASAEPGSVFADPQMPRPSPRLGLDIDLTEPSRPAPLRPVETQSTIIDFELSEPGGPEGPGGGYGKK